MYSDQEYSAQFRADRDILVIKKHNLDHKIVIVTMLSLAYEYRKS